MARAATVRRSSGGIAAHLAIDVGNWIKFAQKLRFRSLARVRARTGRAEAPGEAFDDSSARIAHPCARPCGPVA